MELQAQQNLPSQTATDKKPLISIEVVGDRRILETPDEAGETTFKTAFRISAHPRFSSDRNAFYPRYITIHISQEGNYLAGSLTNGILVKSIPLHHYLNSDEFEVELNTNMTADGNGKIIAEIQPNEHYQTGNYSKTASVSIIDDESLPVLTINNPNTVSESAGSVTFKITAKSQPAGDSLRVQYGLREPTGDFLVFQAPSYLPLEARVLADSQLLNFTPVAGGEFEADLVIELDDDEVVEHDGSVSVTLVSDTNFTYRVVAGSNDVGVVQVTDDEVLPILTINNPSSISESARSVSYTVTSDTQITSLEVHYELREPTGDFPCNK